MRPDISLVGAYPPLGVRHGGSSGVASYTANLAHALSAEGAAVTVIAPEEDRQPPVALDGGVRVERRFRRGGKALPAAASAAVATGARVSHLQFETFLYGGPASLVHLAPALLHLRRGGTGVATLHQVVDPADVDRDFTALHRVRVPPPVARAGLFGLQRTVARGVDRVVVHEPSFASVVPGATVIPHGVEAPGEASVDRAAARIELGVEGRHLVVLCFGFVAPYKGLEVALAAGELAADDVRLVVAGGEHPRLTGRDPYAAHLRRRWDDLARFTGFVPADQVAPWYAAADLCLFPYPRPFSSSGALALALAHDRPVLLSEPMAASVGAAAELAVPAEPVALAVRLRELARDRRALDRLRDASRRLAIGRDWPSVARSHVDLYEEVIREEGAARRSVRPVEPG
jgi:glycosyltransferase involved in cell wall biosynthesis